MPGSATIAAMLIVTTNDIPGYRIRLVLGEAFGITVRSLGFGGGFSSLGGGEVSSATRLVIQCRNEAMGRLVAEACNRGANAIVGMRFDTGALTAGVNEVCAYGTAVWVDPVTDDAQAQYAQLVAAGRIPQVRPVEPPLPGHPAAR